MPALVAQSVSKKFADTEALNDVSFSLGSGEILCLLGPNGAGKTTLINVFLGFIQPDCGSVSVFGVDPSHDLESARRNLSYVPEFVAIYDELTALQNLELFNSFAEDQRSTSELSQLLERVGLSTSSHNSKTADFSKGMRQKVGLAIALSKNANVILLDEPFTGLDPVSATDFCQLVDSLREEGKTVLLATHDLFRVSEIATQIAILRNGRIHELVDGRNLGAYELEEMYLGQMRKN